MTFNELKLIVLAIDDDVNVEDLNTTYSHIIKIVKMAESSNDSVPVEELLNLISSWIRSIVETPANRERNVVIVNHIEELNAVINNRGCEE